MNPCGMRKKFSVSRKKREPRRKICAGGKNTTFAAALSAAQKKKGVSADAESVCLMQGVNRHFSSRRVARKIKPFRYERAYCVVHPAGIEPTTFSVGG